MQNKGKDGRFSSILACAGILLLVFFFFGCGRMARNGENSAMPIIRMDGILVNMNQGEKYLSQEKFGVKYSSAVPIPREIEARGRKEIVEEQMPLGWDTNVLAGDKKWINFRLYVSNPAKIVHWVTYFQKVNGEIVQEAKESADSIADFKNHYCRFPVIKSGDVVEFGARIDLYSEDSIYASIMADGFRYKYQADGTLGETIASSVPAEGGGETSRSSQ